MKSQPGYPQRRVITYSMADKYAICFIFDGIQHQNLCREQKPDGTYNYSEKCLSQLPFSVPFLGFDGNSSTTEYDSRGLVRYHAGHDQNDFPDVFSAISYYWIEVFLLCLVSALLFHFIIVLLRRRSTSSLLSNRGRFSSPSVDDRGTITIGKLSFNPNYILGYGSRGTCVFKGSFEEKQNCAVKRIVSQYLKLADREIDFLRSLQNPHLVRYLSTEEDAQFIYIALEQAEFSLADLIDKNLPTKINLSKEELCYQAALGLRHLHKLDIVHRDLKPQNILISFPARHNLARKVMISDFGISKYLNHNENDHSSSAIRSYDGTQGWMAPEVVEAKLSDEKNLPSKAADVFSLGCVFYYILSDGKHPFGNHTIRQVNILSGRDCMESCKFVLSEEQIIMATHMIQSMISLNPKSRPPIGHIIIHPLFWSRADQLQFLLDVSDRVEKSNPSSYIVRSIETNRIKIIGFDWSTPLCEIMRANLTKFRSYRLNKITDLLRIIRNKKHHYNECSEDLKQTLGEVPDGLMLYFGTRFPRLLPHIYTAMQLCRDESMFKPYYERDMDDHRMWKFSGNGHGDSNSTKTSNHPHNGIAADSSKLNENSSHNEIRSCIKPEKLPTKEDYNWPNLITVQTYDLSELPQYSPGHRSRQAPEEHRTEL